MHPHKRWQWQQAFKEKKSHRKAACDVAEEAKWEITERNILNPVSFRSLPGMWRLDVGVNSLSVLWQKQLRDGCEKFILQKLLMIFEMTRWSDGSGWNDGWWRWKEDIAFGLLPRCLHNVCSSEWPHVSVYMGSDREAYVHKRGWFIWTTGPLDLNHMLGFTN